MNSFSTPHTSYRARTQSVQSNPNSISGYYSFWSIVKTLVWPAVIILMRWK